MASSNDELTQLLRNLANAKSLNTQAPANTAQATLQNAQMQFRDYGINSIANAPNLKERITAIEAGKPPKPSGVANVLLNNPVSKAGLKALVVWDTPRRAVISGVREIVDVLDSDPNTKASFSDFYNQAKDPAYGFGTAFPIPGWKGRIIGAIGDFALDPMMHINLGTRLGKEIVGGTEVAAKTLFGKHLIGAEARNKLAEWTAREMRTANEVSKAAGMAARYSEEEIAKTAATISARGKSAVPAAIAEKFGIPKPGIYFFGSRVRVPGSGLIASTIESGITATRLGIANSRVGDAILRKITRTGVAGALAPLSAEYVRNARIGLAQGKMSGKEVTDALRLLNFDEDRRIATTLAGQKAKKSLEPIFNKISASQFGPTISRLLDNPTPEVLAAASTEERNLAEQIRSVLVSMHGEVETAMKSIDPGFKVGNIEDYFPWMLTEEARKAIGDGTSIRAQEIMKYAKINVNDVASSFRSRNIRLGQEFYDVKSLAAEQLNARSLNDIARPTLGFDLFETDATKVLAQYANNYAEQMGSAAFYAKLAQEPDMMKFVKQNFQVSPDYITSLEEGAAEKLKAVGEQMKTVQQSLNTARSSVAEELKKATDAARTDVAKSQAELRRSVNVKAGAKVYEQAQKTAAELKAHVQELQKLQLEVFAGVDANNTLVSTLQAQINELDAQLSEFGDQFDSLFTRPSENIPGMGVGKEAYAPESVVSRRGKQVAVEAKGTMPTDYAQKLAAGQFAELTPEQWGNKAELLKVAEDKLAKAEKNLRNIYNTFQSVNAFHNEIPFFWNHMEEALAGTGGTFVDRFAESIGFKYSDGVYGAAKPIELINKRTGKLWQDAVRNYWSAPNRGEANKARELVYQLLNPNGKITGSALEKYTQNQVVAALANAATSGASFDKIQEAIAWVMLRELRMNPELEKLIVGAVDSIDDPRAMALYTRWAKLQDLNERFGKLQETMMFMNRGVVDAEVGLEEVTDIGRAASGTKEVFAGDTQYRNVIEQLATVREEINKGIAQQINLVEASPIQKIAGDYQTFVGSKTGAMSENDIDHIFQLLDDAGYAEIADAIDNRSGTITYEQTKQLLDAVAEEDAGTIKSVIATPDSPEAIQYAELERNLSDLRSEESKLLNDKKRIEAEQNLIQRNIHATLQRTGGYQEFIREYSDSALELYAYSETSLQFRKLSEIMAVVGAVPSMEAWGFIRSDVARTLGEGATEVKQNFDNAINIMRDIQKVVHAAPARDQYGILRQELEKVLDDPQKGKVVSRFFPEFDAIINRGGLGEVGKLEAADAEVMNIKNQLMDMYAQVTVEAQTGRRSGQAYRITGPGTKNYGPENDRIINQNLQKINAMRANMIGSPEQQIARLTSGKARPRAFIDSIRERLTEMADAQIPLRTPEEMKTFVSDYSIKAGYVQPEEFEKKLAELENQYENAMVRIKAEAKTKRALAKQANLIGEGRSFAASVGKTKAARANNIMFGFAGLLDNALRNTQSASDVRAFFNELLGGGIKYVDGKPTIVSELDSYAARTQEAMRRRATALGVLADPSVPVVESQVLQNALPGVETTGKRGPILMGPIAYAEELDSQLKLLTMQLAQDEQFQKYALESGIQIENAKKGLPFTPEQVDALRAYLQQDPEKVGNRLWRFVDAEDSVIKELPKPLQDTIYSYRQLKIEEQRLLSSELYPVAESQKRLHDVIATLAPLELDQVYNAAKELSFDPFSVYGPQIWNAPRPGVIDGLGNPVYSNVDSSLLETYLATLPERRGVLESAGSSRTYTHTVIQAEVVPFTRVPTYTDSQTGRAFSNHIFLDQNGVQLKNDLERAGTAYEQALRLHNQGQQVTVLKPLPVREVIQESGVPRQVAELDAARIHSGNVYDPAKTWVLLPEDATGATVKPAMGMPLPINRRTGSGYAFTYEGAPLSFSKVEKDALFAPPIVDDVETVTVLEAQKQQLERERPQIGRKSSKADKALAKQIDAKIDAIDKKLIDIFERPVDVKRIGQLQREINDLERQIPVNRMNQRTVSQKKLAEIDNEIAIRRHRIDVIRARKTAEAKVQSMIDRVMSDKDMAYALGVVKRYGDLPEEPVKAFKKIVDMMQHGVTPDDIPMPISVGKDLVDARKGMARSRFDSTFSGEIYRDLGRIRKGMQDLRSQEFLKDYDKQLQVIQRASSERDKILLEHDASFTTPDTIQKIQDTLGELTREQRLGQQTVPAIVQGEPGARFVQTAKGKKPIVIPTLRQEGERSVGLLRQDSAKASSELRTMDAQRRQLVGELNALQKIVTPSEAEIARIADLVETKIPQIEGRIEQARQQVQGIDDAIRAVATGFDGKTAEQIKAVSEQIRNAQMFETQRMAPQITEGLAALRAKFGEASQPFRNYRDLVGVLSKYPELYKELENALKMQTELAVKGQKAISMEAQTAAKRQAYDIAQATFDNLLYHQYWSANNLVAAQRRLEDVKTLAEMLATVGKQPDKQIRIAEFMAFYDEAKSTLESLGKGDVPKPVQQAMAQFVEQMNTYHSMVLQMSEAQVQARIAKGIDEMYRNMPKVGNEYSNLPVAFAKKSGTLRKEESQVINGIQILQEFEKGFVAFGELFPNMQITKELKEIFDNGQRLRDPVIAQELSRFMGSYTKFFKAYATMTPGFHVRNSIANTLQMFFGGGSPKELLEGLQVRIAWNNAERAGKTWEQFLKTLPAERAAAAETARISVAASGGGVYSEFAKELDTSNKWINNPLTQKSRSVGEKADDFARFIFGYDAAKQGLDYRLASARTKRFFVDYMDKSDLDKTISQVVPFWMWTSRNLPTQLTNMWLNPKPYLIYNTIKRNLTADTDSKYVPQYLTEMGAFKLPFGDNMFATLDTPYSAAMSTIQQAQDPGRLLSNLNPLLKLPIELAGGRQLYNNRQFSDVPVPVSGAAASIYQPLLQALGYGATNSKGEKFVSDKAYYALRNLVPFLATAERLSPTISTYQDRGNANALLGFGGIPLRQVTPQMQASALAQLQKQMQAEAARNKALEGG